eukprot:Nitzschia sp. Nitz4//scaffold205_size38804//23986//26605//NITZ4_007646-RA/size38804-processed-gene-0.7-mRNA-1//1//CDS//3329541519//5844//frame0
MATAGTKGVAELALQQPGIGPAAHLIRDAVLGERSPENWYDPYEDPDKPLKNFLAVFCARLIGHRLMVRLLQGAAWLLVILTFTEPPAWCQSSELDILDDSELDSFGPCGVIMRARGVAVDGEENVQLYPNASAMWLTPKQSHIIELACLGVIFFFMIAQLGSDGFEVSRFLEAGFLRNLRLFKLAMVLYLFTAVIVDWTALNPFFRLMLLGAHLKAFQKELWSFFRMLPQVATILSILAIIIIFYGWFGAVIFYESKQGIRDFANLFEGCWTMWICVTTANYPDVMMPSYNNNRLSGIFFVSYMVVTFFLLMNLVLASVVNAYDETIQSRKKMRQEVSQDCLTKAFHLMDPDNTGRVNRDTIMALFVILNEDFPEIRELTGDETKLLFGFLDRDGSSMISLEEFRDFGSVLLLEFTKESDYQTIVERNFPTVFHSHWYQQLCTLVRSNLFERIVDLLLLLNAILIGIQSFPELTGKSIELNPLYLNGHLDTWEEYVETVFTTLYVIEALLRITVDGWKKYSESTRNMFDFLVTVCAVLATAYVYYPNEYSDSRLIRFVVMARVFRLGRLLMIIPAFQTLGNITSEILPGASEILLLLFFLMYWFAALGVVLYGGLITRDPANPLSEALLGNDFSDNDYWANNFNDLMSGMNVLFNLLVVNNWTNCEIGFEAVTGAKWVRWFFLSFHVLGVILVNNLVIAFIINAFLQQLDMLEARNNEDTVEGEAVIKGERALFNASEITGTKTGASGGYYARIRSVHADVDIDEREGLRRLFTRNSSMDG